MNEEKLKERFSPKKELVAAALNEGFEYQWTLGPYFKQRVGPFNHWLRRDEKGFIDSIEYEDAGCPTIVKSTEEIMTEPYRTLLLQNTEDSPLVLFPERFKRHGGKLPEDFPYKHAYTFQLFKRDFTPKNKETTLEKAIEHFRKLKPPYEDPTDFIGSCMVIPYDFNKVCRNHYGLDNDDVLHFGDGVNSWHEVSVFGDTVIDWTVRQYSNHRNDPYPLVYKLGDDRGVFGKGIIIRNPEDERQLIQAP